MTPLRRVISFLVGLAFALPGGWLVYEEVTVSGINSGRFVAASAFLLLMGGWMIWVALFDRPRAKTAEGGAAGDKGDPDA